MFDASFWVAVAFVAFVGILVRFAYGRIVGALDARAARIENEIEEARRLREEARQLLAGYQRRHRDAVKEADEIVEQAKADAERMAAQAAADLEAEIRRRTELAHAKIARAEAQVIEDVRDMAVDAAVRAAGRLVRERLGEEQAGKIVDDAISELGRKIH
ncbi:MAG: F0F1 ATP synthase subunit B [Rhodospirillaceae bacterium]|nr:F0F1 ATP synthase subunit B [Rhodospirillaceae bacterium]